MSFPQAAIGPDGKLRSILVTPDGKLVTDQNPLPPTVIPISQGGLILTADGKVRL
jgi:hypothetical protein